MFIANEFTLVYLVLEKQNIEMANITKYKKNICTREIKANGKIAEL